MTDAFSRASTRNSKWIKATPEALYRAFTDPAALAVWQAPGDMTGKVHRFDYRVGGGYQMSLYYPSSETTSRGKTEDREDRYTARFVELTPPRKIVEAITFDTVNPAFKGEMIMEACKSFYSMGGNLIIKWAVKRAIWYRNVFVHRPEESCSRSAGRFWLPANSPI